MALGPLVALSEEFVRSRVLEWLGKNNYVPLKVKTLAEHGADITARKARSHNYFIIECKGEPETHPEKMRYPTLVAGLGEIVQRVRHEKHYRYGLAVPETFLDLVKRRVPSIAMKRLGLELLFVGVAGEVERWTWRDLKYSRQLGVR